MAFTAELLDHIGAGDVEDLVASLEVRAALGASLQSVRHHARAATLLERLVSGGEPELKLLLGVHQESPPAVPANIPPGTEPSRGTLERLEAELDRHPKQAFELLDKYWKELFE